MVEDPYTYLPDKTRLLMPKLVINAAGDEFLQGDNDQYWWDYMPGPKFRQMCQNAEHSEATGITEIVPSVAAFVSTLLSGKAFPNITWTIDPTDGHITLKNDPNYGRPHNVTMWHAPSYKRNGLRDWRLVGGYPQSLPQPVLWNFTVLAETAPNSNTWIASQAMPAEHWVGFFIEVFFPGVAPFYDPTKDTVYRLTTQISIIPKDLWYTTDCFGEACYGTLV